MGRLGDAAATFDRAVGLAEALRTAGVVEAQYQRTLATALLERAEVEYLRGRFAEAEATARRAVELYDGLRNAPANQTNPADPLLAAMAVNRVALAVRDGGRPADALPIHNDAVARLDKLAGPQANRDVTYWSARVRLERGRAAAMIAEQRPKAEPDYAAAVRTLETLVTDYPLSPQYRELLATAALGRGELTLPTTDADLTRARELLEKLVAEYSALPVYRGLLGRTCLALGRRAAATADPTAAAEWFRKAGIVLEGAQKRDPENVFHRLAAEELEQARK